MQDINIHCKYDKLIPIESFVPHDKNANKHPKKQIDLLARLIKFQGVRHPIIISNLSGKCVAGHGRFEALKQLGFSNIPVDYQDFEDVHQELAFLVSDNKIQELAETDEDLLNQIALDMPEDFDLDLLGIPDLQLDTIDPDKEAIEDEVPFTPKDPKSKLGDVYEFGNHRLMCGDSTDMATVEKLMNGEKADMVFTDPPYGMSVVKVDGMIGGERKGSVGWDVGTTVGKSKYHKAKVGVYRPIIGDDKPYDPSHLMNMADLKIIWGANHFSEKLPCSPHWIVWNKEMPEGTDFSGAELAWTNIDKKAVKVFKFTWAGMTRSGDRKDELNKRVHPTQKPVGLFVDILNHYEPNSVIDVFGGSGSTLIACEKTNRKCFMMELDPQYVDVIVSRWCKYTGKNKVKLNGKEITWTVDEQEK